MTTYYSTVKLKCSSSKQLKILSKKKGSLTGKIVHKWINDKIITSCHLKYSNYQDFILSRYKLTHVSILIYQRGFDTKSSVLKVSALKNSIFKLLSLSKRLFFEIGLTCTDSMTCILRWATTKWAC